MNLRLFKVAFASAWLVSVASPANAARTYAVSGSCAGFPKVALTTRPGSCVGFVGSGLGFPRGLAEHRGHIYITDLGSRLPGRGRVLRVRLDQPWKPVVVLTHLDRPGAIVTGPEGYLYVAESNRIFRFNPDAPSPAASVQAVLTGLPTNGLHNLRDWRSPTVEGSSSAWVPRATIARMRTGVVPIQIVPASSSRGGRLAGASCASR